jgi:hypothetical protein
MICGYCYEHIDESGECLCSEGYKSIMINDVVLTGKSAKIFLDAINNPPQPNEALKKLLKGIRK